MSVPGRKQFSICSLSVSCTDKATIKLRPIYVFFFNLESNNLRFLAVPTQKASEILSHENPVQDYDCSVLKIA